MAFKSRPHFYMVWNPSTGKTYYRHKTIESAQKEAQRLADENGGKFHVLIALGRCTADKLAENKATKTEEEGV